MKMASVALVARKRIDCTRTPVDGQMAKVTMADSGQSVIGRGYVVSLTDLRGSPAHRRVASPIQPQSNGRLNCSPRGPKDTKTATQVVEL